MDDTTTFCIDALAELFYSHLKEVEDLLEHIEHCTFITRHILSSALAKNIERFDLELKDEIPSTWEYKDRRERTIITLVGKITYSRAIYIDEAGNRRYPVDEVLGITTYQRLTPDAFTWIVKCASNISYEKTAKAFKEFSGVDITRGTVKRCVWKAGDLLAESASTAAQRPITTPVLFFEFDGFWVNLQSEHKLPRRKRRTYKAQFAKKSCELKVAVAYPGKIGNRRISPLHMASDSLPEKFFTECMTQVGSVYSFEELDYLRVGADAAGWCKAHGLEVHLDEGTAVISTLDPYHVNQRLYRAFSSEEDRAFFLGLLYKKNYKAFLKALETRMALEPEDERIEKRAELYNYITNNLDWLDSPSITRLMRERLLSELPCMFAGRNFYDHLYTLLSRRRYKRFLNDLRHIVKTCEDSLYADYSCFLRDAEEVIRLIRLYGRMTLGTMEGTNSKVYAARLKVWGCAWSRRGAIAMMRVRAALASGKEIIAPGYSPWLNEKERQKIEKYRGRGFSDITESSGKGYEPPAGHITDAPRGQVSYARCFS